MDIRDYLSDDGQAVLALCSAHALPEGAAATGGAPLTLSEFNEFMEKVEASPLKSPSALQGSSADELAKLLALPLDEAQRIVRLLNRSGRLALELESLFSRGIWAVTRVDDAYPARLRQTLQHQAPSVLFGSGDIQLLRKGGVAVVGSRNIDEAGTAFALEVGRRAAAAKMPVVSGGARGSDRLAMTGALEAGGISFGVIADSLDKTIRQADLRQMLLESQLVMLTPYAPTAGFSIGAAMGRNKVIYGLAEFAVVVSSDFQTGGTWAGAVEALKGSWCPVFVRDGENVPKGNRELLKMGAFPFPEGELAQIENLADWLRKNSKSKPGQQDLFQLDRT
jgi:DNA processing protein